MFDNTDSRTFDNPLSPYEFETINMVNCIFDSMHNLLDDFGITHTVKVYFKFQG